MKPARRKVKISTCIRQLRKSAMNRNKEIEITGCEVTQIQINRTA